MEQRSSRCFPESQSAMDLARRSYLCTCESVIAPLLTGDLHTQASSCSTTSWGSQSLARLPACPLPKGQPSRSRRYPAWQPRRLVSAAGTASCPVSRKPQVGRTGLGPTHMRRCRTRLGASRCSVMYPDRDRNIEQKCWKAVVAPRKKWGRHLRSVCSAEGGSGKADPCSSPGGVSRAIQQGIWHATSECACYRWRPRENSGFGSGDQSGRKSSSCRRLPQAKRIQAVGAGATILWCEELLHVIKSGTNLE